MRLRQGFSSFLFLKTYKNGKGQVENVYKFAKERERGYYKDSVKKKNNLVFCEKIFKLAFRE